MKKMYMILVILVGLPGYGVDWGYHAHRHINRLAVFTLPPEMLTFYKHHIQFLTLQSVNPDRRRYAVEGEAPRHFIDLDHYGDSAWQNLPHFWPDAVEQIGEDTLMAHGILPWYLVQSKQELTKAFAESDAKSILRISADLGHYIADAHVPLHTTKNYNGQLTGQEGIHGFWESRVPELLSEEFDFFVGPAEYISHPQNEAWNIVSKSHLAVDSVLSTERDLTQQFGTDKKYSFEERLGVTTKVYSKEFTRAYQQMLRDQPERRMRSAIKMVGSFWYTCWIDSGQPDLDALLDLKMDPDEIKQQATEAQIWKEAKFNARPHE
ncbi:MAG: zinc dependent phospholipase C family protein [Cyclobacteriaceae bacterium]